jgi:hypothetical protein
MGSASGPWRVAQTRLSDFGTNRFAVDAPKGPEAYPNVDDVPSDHVGQLASIDFFTVATVQLRILDVFIILSHDRRRVIKLQCHPASDRSLGGTTDDAFPDDTAPRFLVRDRDGIYGECFKGRVEGMGIEQICIAPRSPWQNCYVERLIGSIRRECLNHVIVVNDHHLRRLLANYFRYYHDSRMHLSLGKDAPKSRAVQSIKWQPIVQFPEVGGVHHRYEQRAA